MIWDHTDSEWGEGVKIPQMKSARGTKHAFVTYRARCPASPSLLRKAGLFQTDGFSWDWTSLMEHPSVPLDSLSTPTREREKGIMGGNQTLVQVYQQSARGSAPPSPSRSASASPARRMNTKEKSMAPSLMAPYPLSKWRILHGAWKNSLKWSELYVERELVRIQPKSSLQSRMGKLLYKKWCSTKTNF